ncbi:hypothetical protein CHS0354_022140 [Potamilus streckersoni]|uniref:KICSTOR complex protein SZT2 n=1 Tax=Potamilus streckersoni TaxID=2493646 RepID=A0AAE0VJK9_9BIVA|nr:hypothetical protein CHS0354_022140 [Potamilus streckersoni]
MKAARDVIGSLPPLQQEAVTKCGEEIEWLLKDEIVSSLRLIQLISSEDLQFVTNHIQQSAIAGKANCSHDTVQLQFVFGLDQSLPQFREEFEKMNLPLYRLVRENDWYYVVKNRSHISFVNAVALSTALDELKWEGGMSREKLDSSGSKSELVETMDTIKTLKVISPNQSKLSGAVTSPLALNQSKQMDSPVSQSKQVQKELQNTMITKSGADTEIIDDNLVHDATDRQSRYSLSQMIHNKEVYTKISMGDEVLEAKTVLTGTTTTGTTTTVDKRDEIPSESKDEKVVLTCTHLSGEAAAGEGIRQGDQNEEHDEKDGSSKTFDEKDIPFGMESSERSSDPAKLMSLTNVGAHGIVQKPNSLNLQYVETEQQSLEAHIPDMPTLLTSQDSQAEDYTGSEEFLQPKEIDEEDQLHSHDEDDDKTSGILKRCSSFAGFKSVRTCEVVPSPKQEEILSQSPAKTAVPALTPIGRLRHFSAPSSQGTPRSNRNSTIPPTPSWQSSRGSFTEDAYDGDMSEIDDSGTSVSENSSMFWKLPNFWLVMLVGPKAVDIFYQRRESGRGNSEEILKQRELLSQVKGKIESICQKVNQILLLNDLYENRNCHMLLVPEADEEVTWNLDTHIKKNTNLSSSSEADDDDLFERKYLAAAMNLGPGHFDCDCVFKICFTLHPRLKTGQGRTGVSRGLQALRSVLNKFCVINRKNMFVIKESTQAVFYLRLKETFSSSRQLSTVSLDDMNDSSSGGWRCIDSGMDKEKDLDTISLTSTTSALSSTQRGGYERVELYVHGIQDPGPEIKVDLMRLLQSKLDESVLDIITVMLRRNPVCKLSWDDVQFIQPLGSSPTEKLLLTLPSRVSQHLRALQYYLRQNLLQFLNVPNYVDTRPDRKFMDMIDGKMIAIPDDQVFLYIRSHSSGGTGIACVSVSLVDGKEQTVRLLHCPKPSSQAHSSVHTQSDLEAFIHTEQYEAKGKRPGPTALIQFRIWERGSIDITVLKEKLIGALRHALCDVVIEYYLLTAPICEIPHHLQELPSLPIHSAPSSPLVTKVEDIRERKFSLVLKKKSDSAHHKLERRQSLQNQSPLQSLKEAIMPPKRVLSPPPDMHKTFDLTSFGTSTLQQIRPGHQSEIPSRSQLHENTSQLLEKYQCGTFGNLHKVYTLLMEDWFSFCCQNGVPTVFQLELCLKSQFSVDFILQELQNIIGNICSDINIKIFKVIPGKEMEELPVGIIYNPCRHPLPSSNISEETSVDAVPTVNFVPGKIDTFIGIGRNFNQWQFSIESDLEEESGHSVTGVTQKVLSKQTSQKFYSSTQSTTTDKTVIDECESNFVPRQRLLMIFIKHKQMVVFTYNWASDFNSSLSKYLTRLVQWHNARAHLLNSIITQKMGLFNHYLFSDLANVPNPFINTSDVDHLIRSSTPSSKEHIRRTNSMTAKDRTPSLLFDTTFKDVFPWKTVHANLQVTEKDPVTQHGQQAQEIRRGIKKEEESLLKIQKLYLMWLKKTAGPNIQISEDDIVLLKQHSRLFHYCATPLLFFAQWRHKVLEKYRATGLDSHSSPVSASVDSKSQRSRHSSGTSVGSVRTKHTDGQDGKKKQLNMSSSMGKLTDSPEYKTYDSAIEEDWHRTLLQEFRLQYIAYLQTIGFHYIHTTPVSYKHRSDRRSEQKFEEIATHHRNIFNLQKTLSGGILLIELSFHAEYFCVKLYTYESSRLSDTVNQQMKLMFVDECEKCKDIIHVHSFAHDFHLRCVQAYLNGEQKGFPPNYHVVNFLIDFIKVYPYAPSFSRNFLQQDVVTIPKPSCSGQQLYEYMLNHANLYNMTSLKMQYHTDPEIKDLDYSLAKMVDYALVSNFSQEILQFSESSKPEKESYSFGLIIFQDPYQLGPDMDRSSLVLKFFIVLTSCGELFPRHTLEKTLGVLRGHKIHQSQDEEITIEDKNLKDFTPISHLLGVPRDPPNYLGFSNTYQPPMYQMLQKETEAVRQKIEQMAAESMEKCRRDVLWQRMLVGDRSEEEAKRKKRSDTEDSKDPLLRLSYEELCELLGRAHRCPLCEIDSRLITFQHMSITWYAGLAQVLSHKYQDDLRRYFSSPDGQVQYHIILNANNLDMFMMLCIDNFNNKAELSAVFKKQAKEQESRDSKQTEEETVQTHIENFVNACCFHLWTSML